MTAKSVLSKTIRFGLCAAAVLWVLRGISLNDSITLADGTTLNGAVSRADGRYFVRTGGQTQTVAAGLIARDASGTPRIVYGLRTVAQQTDPWAVAAALAVFLMVPVLQAVRLRAVLRSQSIEGGFAEHLRLAFAGNFMNFAAPFGSTAGDVYKAWHFARRSSAGTEAASLVLVDRAIGLGTLLLTVGLIALAAGADSRLGLLRPLLIGLSSAMLAGGAVYLLPMWRQWSFTQKIAARLPKRDQLARIDTAIRRLLSSPGVLLKAMGITVILQIFAAASFVCMAAGLCMFLGGASGLEWYAYFSAGEIVKAIPGPPQGLGTMELAYTYFFAGLGSAAQILTAAIGVRAVNLLCSLPGALLLFGRETRSIKPSSGHAATRRSVSEPVMT
ncbi:MAG: flippase-like domain-containing protein [Phycisphaerales bacterium]|nr:flippase-like domain-containing protein [Phycisphaerales bacterium]